ncbi:MAG: hypothetical protein GY765_04865 [bacterium]|nr:hypothetical protein [bacterium]
MIIDINNYEKGNKAIAAVLSIYYHLMEAGIFSDPIVFLDPDDFDGFTFLNVEVKDDGGNLEIDRDLLREGAVIYLLCHLNDMIEESNGDYQSYEYTKRIITAYKEGKLSAIPEVDELFRIFMVPESALDYDAYWNCFGEIYKKYVWGRFERLLKHGRL